MVLKQTSITGDLTQARGGEFRRAAWVDRPPKGNGESLLDYILWRIRCPSGALLRIQLLREGKSGWQEGLHDKQRGEHDSELSAKSAGSSI